MSREYQIDELELEEAIRDAQYESNTIEIEMPNAPENENGLESEIIRVVGELNRTERQIQEIHGSEIFRDIQYVYVRGNQGRGGRRGRAGRGNGEAARGSIGNLIERGRGTGKTLRGRFSRMVRNKCTQDNVFLNDENFQQPPNDDDHEWNADNEEDMGSDSLVSTDDEYMEDEILLSGDEKLSDAGSDKSIAAITTSESDGEYESMRSSKRNGNFDPFKEMEVVSFTRTDDGDIILKENQVFDDVYEYRKVLRDYAIKGGYLLHWKVNDKNRVTVLCKGDGCQWRVHASALCDKHTFMIKTLIDEHSCIRPTDNKNPNANTKWVTSKLHEKLAVDGNMSYDLMEKEMQQNWGIQPPKWQLYKARNAVKESVEGSHAESYKFLKVYIKNLMNINPGTFVKFEHYERQNMDEPGQFKRIFIAFEPLIIGFLEGCRPLIGVDGCHLKGPYGGCLLNAVALGGNRGILPIAIAIVEGECYQSWEFFLDCLKQCIGGEDEGKHYTFMSDRQKGLIEAVSNIFPTATHRYCCRHIFSNFIKQFPEISLRPKFWMAARSTTGFSFWAVMKEIQKIDNGKASKWLLKIKLKHWCKHAFTKDAKSDLISNNMSESFNAWIGKLRGMPITTLLDCFREKCMVR
ncbi:uncharacterized protein LOC126682088 [Mercurialis annua]|uniref:uncharacterized protein LOC126682088 n=1 Tax=Mercurialis annua TaxID=3986 RepID=UPI00215E3644|nr:uncharacterized protein LOC126682088 [Mercurialis annua]